MSALQGWVPRDRRAVLAFVATALIYATVGWFSLAITGPLGYASPLYPPAGIALAVALIHGRRALPAIWLGAFAVNTGLTLQHGAADVVRMVAPMCIGLGAALQAGLGASLVLRYVSLPVVLNAPRDILRFGLLGGVLACVISPSVATLALLVTGGLAREGALSNWLTWWVGDTLGVLIAAPLALSFIGLPRADWLPRRRTLALPLLVAMALLTWGMLEFLRLDQQRLQATFQRDADRLASEARLRMAAPLHALQALHGASRDRGGFERETLIRASRWWLGQPIQLQAMAYSERVPVAGLSAFEAKARAQGDTTYRVFDRDAGAARAADGEVVALRYIEPAEGNRSALGINVLSIPATRAAILLARDSGQPQATAGFGLTQSSSGETGIVLYQALYRGEPTNTAERRELFSGLVSVTLRSERVMQGLAQPGQRYLQWCLVDSDGSASRSRLAGPAGCERPRQQPDAALAPFTAHHLLDVGGRDAELRIWASPHVVPGRQREASGLLSLAGLAAAAMLGALLLTVTGHSRRTEKAVDSSTAVLRREMSDRAQAEAALRESETRLRSILDHVPLGVMFLDTQGRVIESNPRLRATLGLSPGQLRETAVLDLVRAEERPRLLAMRRALLTGPTDTMVERLHLNNARGEERTLRITVSALRDENNQVQRLVCVLEDITEHTRLEDSEKARHRAEAASRAKSEFVSRMSHELRTPLNAMIGFAQLLGMDKLGGLGDVQREWVEQIQRAGWHLLEMINETLELARIESGSIELKLAPVALEPLVNACLAMVAPGAEQRGISVACSIDPQAGAVVADEMRLKQVLTNLMSNAVKYNSIDGALTVTARPAAVPHPAGGGQMQDGVELTVSDTGLGMTPEQLGALFQPYNRLGREGSGIEGTGIGLVISRSLTELMGGTLEASSEAGVGSIFTLRLPAASSAEAPPSRYSDTNPAPYRERRVHYVEDNETNIEVMRGVFAQRPQVALGVSMLGLDGVAAIRESMPDLILLDMQLPDISGVELLRHLKNDDSVAHIPVIIVSADATPHNIQEALVAGALHYVTKPLDLTQFLALVDDVLDKQGTRW